MCRVAQTSCRIVQAPQFQVSTLLERDTRYKQAEGRWTAADQIVAINVRLEIRIWGFQFVNIAHSQASGTVQICSFQLPLRSVASPEASHIIQGIWIYSIHSSSTCWDKAASGGLGCTETKKLQNISQILTPENLAPNILSCLRLPKSCSSLCCLLLHNLACEIMCLCLAQ